MFPLRNQFSDSYIQKFIPLVCGLAYVPELVPSVKLDTKMWKRLIEFIYLNW